MYTNVNLPAPIGVLALLGTGFLLSTAALIFFYTVFKRKFGAMRLVLVGMAVIAAIYIGGVLLFSFASSEQMLARGAEKHFCEIDCHLAYSIADVTESIRPGNAPNQADAASVYYAITIKTRFDETTISSSRGGALLYPNGRVLTVIDGSGRKYLPSIEGQRALEQARGPGIPITTPLRPSESYLTTVVFLLPADIRSPTLLINESEWITHFVIGHENSPLHKKTRFQI